MALRILLVEDDVPVARIAVRLLGRLGHAAHALRVRR